MKDQLASTNMDEKKDALKKVIALMTVGQDVSKLFIDIINCMQQGDIEMKKLVYLYLINYADEKPDLALLAVQSFIRVCERRMKMIE
jgi:beta-adaptin-like protein B